MKILYLITGLGGGGAEKVVADLADQMFQRGYQVKIAYLKGEVIVRPENKSIELIYLGLETFKNSKLAYQNYKKLILEFKPDVVHAQMVHANIFARISRRFIQVPKLICTAHNSNEGGRIRMLAYQLTNSLSNLNTNVSREATSIFQHLKAFDSSAITVYNGINLTRFIREETKPQVVFNEINCLNHKIILAVGRLNTQKDYPNLLKAISLLKNTTDQLFKVVIVGEGDQRASIDNLIKSMNLNSDVFLLGRRSDVPKLMSAADIFVLSSEYEGFGLVVAEAMACETFVVATDCGGVKEVMGGYGLMVKPKDSEALATTLLKALNMKNQEREENNNNALSHIQENFDLNLIIQQWIEIYES